MRRVFFFSLFAAFLLQGCRVSDIRTASINVRGMTDEDDCSAIENELRKLPGAKFLEVKCDLQNGTVNVTYDSMSVALKNLEFAVSQAGFDAGPYRAVEKNKFPEKR